MDWGIIGASFILGLIASTSCLGICIPIMVPFIMERDRTPREGLITSILLSMGRLMIYMGMGIVIFWVGITLTENIPTPWLTITAMTLGLVVIIYGAAIIYEAWYVINLPKPKWCPAKLARNFRPIFSVILGLLIGSFFCPILWIALVRAALTRDLSIMFLSVISFWIGSSTTILAAGIISGKLGGIFKKWKGTQELRLTMGMVLMMVGAMYLINAFIL